jgi:TatA/E family protein of Tat protein translocase
MFGLGGISELVFILFIVMLIFGPEKMPEIARMVAKGLGEVRKASNELKRTLNAELALGEQEVEARRLAAAQAATAHAAVPALAAPEAATGGTAAAAPPLTAQILPSSPLAPFEAFPPTPAQAAPTIRRAALAVPTRAPGAGADRLRRPYSPSPSPTSHSAGDAPVFLVTPYAADRMLPYDAGRTSAAHAAGGAGGVGAAANAGANAPAEVAAR